MADLIAGERMIKNLEDRLFSINTACAEAKSLQQQYSKLIEFMISYPPTTEKHIASMEQELALAKQQLQDLCRVSSQILINTTVQILTFMLNITLFSYHSSYYVSIAISFMWMLRKAIFCNAKICAKK